jgi:hypothetical protein
LQQGQSDDRRRFGAQNARTEGDRADKSAMVQSCVIARAEAALRSNQQANGSASRPQGWGVRPLERHEQRSSGGPFG